MRRLLTLFAAVSLAILPAEIPPSSPGTARFVVRTDPSWDQYTQSPSHDMREWFRSKVWRMEVYSTYWDTRLKWYPTAWVYINLYAIYVGSELADKHPQWILRDPDGHPLYIPWGCNDGKCPQYAGDITDSAFRKNWLASARKMRQIGYKGLFVDDVNLEFRVADEFGKQKTVISPKTKKEITADDWARAVAGFTSEIREEFPQMEIVHNAIWFARGPDRINDPFVRQEVSSADIINLERGANDGGLRGGKGEWSLNAFLDYIDGVHKLNRGVILDNLAGKTEYSLAAFFLVSSGHDAFGDQGLKPEHWWSGLDVALGDPVGPREQWQGLLRRRFSRGVVILNPPDSPPVKLKMATQFLRPDGKMAPAAISLGAAQATILVGPVDRLKSVDNTISVVR